MSYDTAPGISIHAAREGGDAFSRLMTLYCALSIHAAREGGDAFKQTVPVSVYLSIHAAREGGDVYGSVEIDYVIGFQSTPPVKAATQEMGVEYSKPRLSIHAAREGGDVGIIKLIGKFKLSIHAAREGGDDAISQKGNFDNCFQSTPPVKAATLPLPA